MLPILVAQLLKDWEDHPPPPKFSKKQPSSEIFTTFLTIRHRRKETTAEVQLSNTRSPVQIRFQTVKAVTQITHGRHMVVNCLFDSAVKRTIMKENIANALSVNESGGNVTAKVISGISCHPTVSS
ncbi:hypothetical protein T08_13019 [Trichinella sp. T8]|nr:hypothetical protein T08_13019 [Trichinella sp. T8]